MTTPSRSDTVRASSIVQAWRWQHDHHGLPVAIPLLEAAETLSDALAAERRKAKAELDAELIESIRRVIGDPDGRPGMFERVDQTFGMSLCLFVGGMFWASIAWLVFA